MGEARNGQMNASRWDYWEKSGAGDNTSSQPNQYGMSFCIDCTVDEFESRVLHKIHETTSG